jgi:hypothetical protein
LALHGAPLVLIVGALAFGWTSSAHAQAGEMRFSLNAAGASVTCDAPSEPSECEVGLGAAFTLSIDLRDPPAAGYIAMQTQIYLDGMTWTPATTAEESVWPDNNLPLRSPDPPEVGVFAVSYGGLTATTEPFPISHYEGPMVEMHLSCSEEPQTFDPALTAYDVNAATSGSAISLEDQTTVPSPTNGTAELDLRGVGAETVPIADILAIRCGGTSAPPGDDIPGYDPEGTIDGAPPEDTPDITEPTDDGTTPGRTPGGTGGPSADATPTPGASVNGDDDGGGAPWAVIGVVIGAVVVAAAGGAYVWYLRRSRSST